MAFSLPGHWVWDFWLADTGELFHMFYLHAPKSLGHGDLRHRNARIGHATSHNLRDWQPHGEVLGPGAPGSFDQSATWTGSVLQGPDGLWRMYYTGSSFLSPETMAGSPAAGLARRRMMATASSSSTVMKASAKVVFASAMRKRF